MRSSGSSSMSGMSQMSGGSETTGESVADIPIFFPVPFEELSSVQYYTIEEQLLELTAALKEQFERHCFIKIHEEDTQPMLVPFVKSQYTPPSSRTWYLNRLLKKEGALPAAEVDALIEANETALVKEVHHHAETNRKTQASEEAAAIGSDDRPFRIRKK